MTDDIQNISGEAVRVRGSHDATGPSSKDWDINAPRDGALKGDNVGDAKVDVKEKTNDVYSLRSRKVPENAMGQMASTPARDRALSITTSDAASALLESAARATRHAPDLQGRGSFLRTNSFLQVSAAEANPTSAERRGSGFLLLAAEAYEAAERTQRRADAIRQVAMELASAAGGAAKAPPDNFPPPLAQRLDQEPMSASSLFQGLTRSNSDPQEQTMNSSFGVGGEVDDSFREKVYMAAARLKRQQSLSRPAAVARANLQDGGNSPLKTMDPKHEPHQSPPLPPQAAEQPDDNVKVPPSDLLPSGKPRSVPVKHVYHDYASIPDKNFVRKKTGGVSMPFPEKCMRMIDRETELHPDIISWQPHGRAFMVRKPKQFVSQTMSGYFRQSKLTSFQRQLNLYGFRRITQGPDSGAYYHELFLRGRPHLCARMQRQKVKGTGHKQPTDVTTEPNFYSMPFVFDTRGRTGEGAESAATRGSAALPDCFNPCSLYSYNRLSPSNAQSSPTPASPMASPGIRAATLLRRLSDSKVAAPPPLSLDDADCNETTHAAAMAMASMGESGSDSCSSHTSTVKVESV